MGLCLYMLCISVWIRCFCIGLWINIIIGVVEGKDKCYVNISTFSPVVLVQDFQFIRKHNEVQRYQLRMVPKLKHFHFFFNVWSFIMVLYIFTIVNIKKGPTITDSASYSLSSCPFSIVIAFPEWSDIKSRS